MSLPPQASTRSGPGFGDSIRPEAQREVIDAVQSLGAEVESSSPNLLAIAAPEAIVQQVADVLWAYEQRSELVYETGQ